MTRARLSAAAAGGHVEAVRLLREHGATYAEHSGNTLSHVAGFRTFVLSSAICNAMHAYYEITVVAAGTCPQYGWADAAFAPGRSDGVGDDEHSWGVDGVRLQKWHGGEADYGRTWSCGDVVGCAASRTADGAVDFSFSLNGSWDAPMGAAFAGARPTGDLRPALTLGEGAVVTLHFGHEPFRFALPPGASAGGAPLCTGTPVLELLLPPQ